MAHNEKLEELIRKMEIESRLPPLGAFDDADVNFRSIVLQRESLGVETLSEYRLSKIKEFGYDAFFVSLMNSESKIGLRMFHDLSEIGKIELTNEYIVFHNFRDLLKSASRKRIAKLLLRQAEKQS